MIPSLFIKALSKNRQKRCSISIFRHTNKGGNSIVKDRTHDDKALDWASEFDAIIQSGGFDIIVGNPPWGADLSAIREYLVVEFPQIARSQFYAFAIFLYQNLRDLLKPNGILSLSFL